MTETKCGLSRREFIKTAGAVGVGSMLSPIGALAASTPDTATVPTRPFGRTGVKVPILGFGGSLNVSMNLLVLRQAVKWGAIYWDTASSYMGGNSEKGIGKYFEKFPQDRKIIFLVTKSYASNIKGLDQDLNRSLERMRTDYIDLFFIHSLYAISDLDDDIKGWAQKAKSAAKIRFFGFSTHSNMEQCLLDAAGLGWVDGIMMTYNYRLMHTDAMRRAVDACEKAGIGLTAMKTQGGGQVKIDTETELKLAGRFLEKGFTDAQAKLKAVWENPQIASVCSEMPNMKILKENVSAACNKTELSAINSQILQQYAQETASGYCAGCANICEPALTANVPIAKVMRYLMYSRSYGKHAYACERFRKIPLTARRQIADLDYSLAEQRCPQRIPIGRRMREALKALA